MSVSTEQSVCYWRGSDLYRTIEFDWTTAIESTPLEQIENDLSLQLTTLAADISRETDDRKVRVLGCQRQFLETGLQSIRNGKIPRSMSFRLEAVVQPKTLNGLVR
jgi:hypothetical protein